MVMKKIKPKYGKVVPPAVKSEEESATSENEQIKTETSQKAADETEKKSVKKKDNITENKPEDEVKETISTITAEPNPFCRQKKCSIKLI